MELKNTQEKTPSNSILPQNSPTEIIEVSSSHGGSKEESNHDSDLQIIENFPNNRKSNQDASKNLDATKDDTKENKIRKISPRCYICKKVGLRLQTGQCAQCKQWYHLVCLTGKEIKPSYRPLCGNCDPASYEGGVKNQSKKIAIQNKRDQKQKNKEVQLTLKFAQKSANEVLTLKNKQLNNKILQNFRERYPYYLDESQKIKFPIDDKLLVIYRQLFETEKQLPVPSDSIEVPSNYLGDMLIIQNFCMSFKNQIEFPFYPTKQVIYASFRDYPSDFCFKSLLFSLLIIYLGDIFDRNKTENVRALNQNTFFQLLHFLKQNLDIQTFLPPIWKELIEKLQKIPSMSKAFDDLNKLTDITTLDGKIHIVKQLIMGLSEVDTFHDMMYKKTEKKQDMTKQRGELVIQLKKDQAQILTLAQNLKDNEVKCKDLQQQAESSQKKDQVSKLMREQEKIRKNNLKIESEISNCRQNVTKIKARISEINKSIPFITGQIQLLGRDRNQSQYYLYSREPNKIYVNYKKTVLSNNSSFKIISGKESITNYLKYLNQRGTKQRQLHSIIQNHIKCGVISDAEYVDPQYVKPQEPATYQQNSILLTGKEVSKIILECDESFSKYLSKKNCRWTNPLKKDSFKAVLQKNIHDVNILRDSLKFMHEQFLYVENLGGGDDQSDDAKSQKMDVQGQEETFKKKRIRLWGIYFEKIKKYWIDYLDTANTIESVWVSAIIFQHFVERYIRKKVEGAQERQKKIERQLQRERQREKKQRHQKLQRQKYQKNNAKQSSIDEQQQSKHKPHKPVTRGRLVRKSERNVRHANLKQLSSQSQDKYESQESQQQQQSHEDECEICGQFGEMLCCDTCPKVFHIQCLKLKQVPEDQWSCVKCLQKIANQRQTRSRTRKLYIE